MNGLNFEIEDSLLHKTYVVGFESVCGFLETIYNTEEHLTDNNLLRLAVGGCIASEIRRAVVERTGYECSAGIAHNKILAKLCAGLNKPNKQTILPHSQVAEMFQTLPVKKIRSLGGKFGDQVCDSLGITYMSELLQYSEKNLIDKFGDKSGSWLYYMARGVDNDPVVQRLTSQSIGCCKKFPGRSSLTGFESLQHWLSELANEISERLEADIIENFRKAKQLVVSFTQQIKNKDVACSRSMPLLSYDPVKISADGLEIIRKSTPIFFEKNSDSVLSLPIKYLGFSVGKFEPLNKNKSIQNFFNRVEGTDFYQVAPESSKISSNESLVICKNSISDLFSKQKTNQMTSKGVDENSTSLPTSPVLEMVSNVKKKIKTKASSPNICDLDLVLANPTNAEKIENSSDSCNESNAIIAPIVENADTDYSSTYCNGAKLEEVSSTAIEGKLGNSFFLKFYQKQKLSKLENIENSLISNESKSTSSNNSSTVSLSDTSGNTLTLNNQPNSSLCGDYSNIPMKMEAVNKDDTYSSGEELEEILTNKSPILSLHNRFLSSAINRPEFFKSTILENRENDFSNVDNGFGAHSASSDLKHCPKCSDLILSDEFLSHLDYHVALQLSNVDEQLVVKYQDCPECNKRVANLAEHLDEHLAFKISNEQRKEFRMNRSNIVRPTPKSGTKTKVTSKRKRDINVMNDFKKLKPISQFFTKKE